MNSTAFKFTKPILTGIVALLLFSTTRVEAQSTPITVQPTGYAVSINGKPVDIELYTIHKSPYCKIEDLATVMSGVFDVKTQVGKNNYNIDFPVFVISTGKTQTGTSSKGDGQSKKAQSAYVHLYVDDAQRPTTPYKIGNSYFFKVADILRVLDVELSIDDAKKSIAINTNAPFKLNIPKAVISNNAPKKWKKIPANIGIALRCLNSYIDVNSSSLIYNDQSNTDETTISSITIVDIPTGRRLELPFNEKENSYDNIYRGFSEGWVPVITSSDKGRFFTYVNSLGEVINPKMLFTSARAFENGNAFVTYQENGVDYSGVIDLNGELITAVPGKYEDALFSNGVFGFQYFLKRDHNTFYDDYYYQIDGKRLNLTKERAKELRSPGYKKDEVDKFEQYRSKYSKSFYCGYNRFMVESNRNTIVVDSDNRTVFDCKAPMHQILPCFAWGKLFFQILGGMLDNNGKQILEAKYSNIEAVDGEAFLTIINNREQSLIGLDGKVIASSPDAPLYALKKGELVTLRVFLLDSEIIPGDVVMIYSNMDLDKLLPTDRLKNFVSKKPYAERWLMPTHSEAQKIIQSPTANSLYVIALEGLYNTRFTNIKIEE